MGGLKIAVFPFHDLRKCQIVGLQRRDTSVIFGLAAHPAVEKVLVVDRPLALPHLGLEILRRHPLTVRGSVVEQGLGWKISRLSEKLYVLDYFVADLLDAVRLGRGWWPQVMKRREIIDKSRLALKALGMENPILWLFTPISAGLVGALDESLVVFDAIDDWTLHPGMQPYWSAAREGYERIRFEADAIFAVSKALADKLSGGKAAPRWVPNGVDLERFTIDGETAAELEAIARPRVGYSGAVERRVDLALVEQVARALPRVNFVFVGPCQQSVRGLPGNMHFLGRRRYEEVPSFLRGMDACIMPHRVDGFTQSMNPLKLYEYLACGKPVVTTPVAGIDDFAHLLRVAQTGSEFQSAVMEAIEDDGSRAVERREAVRQHSWERIVRTMVERVSEEVGASA